MDSCQSDNLARIKVSASELLTSDIFQSFGWLDYLNCDLELILHRQTVYEAIEYLLSDAGFRVELKVASPCGVLTQII